VDALAKALGVTRGGFYWHFEDRSALLAEMLDSWERESGAEVVERIEATGGDARARLRRLFGMAGARTDVLAVDLAVRDWARRDESVASRLRRADNRRMDYLRALFGEFCADPDDVEARCLVTLSMWIGNHFVAADHNGRSRAQVVESALRRLQA
jgi:AcrR family transcriptional regulator